MSLANSAVKTLGAGGWRADEAYCQGVAGPISARTYVAAFLALACIALIPVWLVSIPPLVDYPNHLARMHILLNLGHSDVLRQYYQVHWAVIPNLAMDMAIPLLGQVLPLEAAGKVFISLTLLLLASGTLALHYALHRRLSIWPFGAFLFLYNGIFLWGFLNYLFGLGLALWALAAWIFLRKRSAWTQILVFSGLATILFFAHLAALGVYGLGFLGYEFSRFREQNDNRAAHPVSAWTVNLAQFAVPALLFALSPTSGSYADAGASKILTSLSPWMQYILAKCVAIFFAVKNSNFLLDAGTLFICVEILVLGFATRRIVLAKSMYWSVGGIAIIFLLMPFRAFSSNFADIRLFVAILFLLIASTELQTVRRSFWVAGLLLVIFSLRMGVLYDQWRNFDQLRGEYSSAVEKLPEGARLFTIIGPDESGDIPPYFHLSCLAVIAKSSFVPSLFAFPTQQPIAFTPAYQALADRARSIDWEKGTDGDRAHVVANYDYLLVVHGDKLKQPLPKVLEPVFSSKTLRLYRTPRAAAL